MVRLDKSTYKYIDLAKKYENFSAPGYEINLAGKTLTPTAYKISGLEVEQSADGTAGGCSFTIGGVYNYGASSWNAELAKLVKPGAKLTVVAGYVERREIFYGYVDDYTMDFTDEGEPRFQISGIDGLGYLMSCRQPLYAGQRKTVDVITSILNKAVSAGYAKEVTVGKFKDFEAPLVKEQVDDWRFLNLVAQRFGASLLSIDGELIFDTTLDQTKEILTLTMGVGLEQFSKRVSLAHQVGEVEIYGRDVNQKPIHAKANKVTVGGEGKSAAQLASAFKNASLREYSEVARTQEECQKLAQHRLNGIAMDLISGSGQCVGIPELIPGRYLRIDGSDDAVDGLYYLTKVRHTFTEAGYQTSFEFKGAKL